MKLLSTSERDLKKEKIISGKSKKSESPWDSRFGYVKATASVREQGGEEKVRTE